MAILFPHRYLIIWDWGEVSYLDDLSPNVENNWDCTIVDLLSRTFKTGGDWCDLSKQPVIEAFCERAGVL